MNNEVANNEVADNNKEDAFCPICGSKKELIVVRKSSYGVSIESILPIEKWNFVKKENDPFLRKEIWCFSCDNCFLSETSI